MKKIIRTSFTQIFGTTNELLTKENPDMNQVRTNIQVLEQKMKNNSQLNQRYLNLLFDQDPEDVDFDSEMAKMDEDMCKFSALKMKVETQVNLSVLKYSQIEFRKFGSDIRD
ncbi:hypothetical protein Zmor_021949 [Zophobas morio]|uniref:Uncharacterized protein n=1 Tax=Zophobas morio TaxID=2755281 RepID=A0AA38I7C2_9CUCU|nr:hypothetical protein Zmor_021949 [Zophobas morio]